MNMFLSRLEFNRLRRKEKKIRKHKDFCTIVLIGLLNDLAK